MLFIQSDLVKFHPIICEEQNIFKSPSLIESPGGSVVIDIISFTGLMFAAPALEFR